MDFGIFTTMVPTMVVLVVTQGHGWEVHQED
jgi:hypothetical protein